MTYPSTHALHFIGMTCLTALLVFGCASQSDIRILEDRVISLERRNMELQQQTEQAAQEKQQLRSKIDTYEESLHQSAGLSATYDQIRDEIQAIKGQIEEMGYRDSQHRQELQNSLLRLERMEKQMNMPPMAQPPAPDQPGIAADPRVERPSQSQTPPAAQPPPPSPQVQPSSQGYAVTPPPSQPETGPAMTEESLYNQGKQEFDRGNFTKARAQFHQLLLQYPNAGNASNAQFWIGETHYKERQYEQAILEYQTVIEKYPKSNKVRASLLKQGFCFANLGDNENAKLILKELVEKHPNSSEAQIAAKKLQSM